LNQLLMPAKSGAVSWLAAAVTTRDSARGLVADAGDDGACYGDADQCGGDGEQFESHGKILR
jgi:hypothetical protein